MSTPESSAGKDPFAARNHFDEVLPARMVPVPFDVMTGYLLTAAGVVMGMPETDSRRPYAAEYGETLLSYTEAKKLEGEMGLRRGEYTPADRIMYGELHIHAGGMMRATYGSADPLPTVTNFSPDFDPEVAFWAGQGCDAVDMVMTGLILGEQPSTAA
jgi:hypothetical protein